MVPFLLSISLFKLNVNFLPYTYLCNVWQGPVLRPLFLIMYLSSFINLSLNHHHNNADKRQSYLLRGFHCSREVKFKEFRTPDINFQGPNADITSRHYTLRDIYLTVKLENVQWLACCCKLAIWYHGATWWVCLKNYRPTELSPLLILWQRMTFGGG